MLDAWSVLRAPGLRLADGGGLGGGVTPAMEFETPYGIIGPPIGYGMACSRYMHEFGEDRTRQALAEIAVATRKWAQLNPKALMRDPMSQLSEQDEKL